MDIAKARMEIQSKGMEMAHSMMMMRNERNMMNKEMVQ